MLTELRFLDGPNLYFPRPAVKLTLDVSAAAALDEQAAIAVAAAAGIRVARPGEPGSGQRQLLLERLAKVLLRAVAASAGTSRLAVRVRPGSDSTSVVLAYPWRRRGRAEALGEAVARLVDDLVALTVTGSTASGPPASGLIEEAGARVAASDAGPGPDLPSPRIPIASVTGTNGKTTVTRLLAHIAMTAGLRTGWTNTDGIYVQGELVEAGDWSGPGGARRVLAEPGLQIAVLETARGGLLLRGMGVDHNDVSVVTNITSDHLGLQGIDTLDQLAEVKAVIVGVTRAGGWTVLNGDDPRTFAMRTRSKAKPWVFSLDHASPSLRTALDEGGRGATVLDGDVVVLSAGSEPDHLLPVADVPLTLQGLSLHNIANALAATAAALGLGLTRESVVLGLRSFQPDASDNPGRMNLFNLRGITVIVDLAHNEAGLEALMYVMNGLRPAGSRTRLVLGSAGDRQDEVLVALGAMAARGVDDVVIGHKERYLRGRTTQEMAALYRAGAEEVGVTGIAEEPTELDGLQVLVDRAEPGDVVAVMCHAQREEIYAWLEASGARPASPAER